MHINRPAAALLSLPPFPHLSLLLSTYTMATEEREGNLLTLMLNEAEDLDLSDPFLEGEERTSSDPKRLMIPGFESVSRTYPLYYATHADLSLHRISRLFAIVRLPASALAAFFHSLEAKLTPRSRFASQIEFAFLHAKDEDGILAGFNMMSRAEAVKAIVSWLECSSRRGAWLTSATSAPERNVPVLGKLNFEDLLM